MSQTGERGGGWWTVAGYGKGFMGRYNSREGKKQSPSIF